MGKRDWSRREFLGRTGSSLLFCGYAGVATRLLTGCAEHTETTLLSGGLRKYVTPTDGSLEDEFYIQFGNPTTTVDNHPRLSPEEWSLSITGAVQQSQTVTYDDLVSLGATDSILFLKTMRCVFDAPAQPLISNGYWRGVLLKHFLEIANPSPNAERLLITGEDGFTNNLKVSRVMDDEAVGVSDDVPLLPVVLAYELNGEPIPSVHGGPVRIVVGEKFGYKNMKFPSAIEVTTRDQPFGYYETDLFNNSPVTDRGNIAITSFFSGPLEGETVAGPTVSLFGVAMYGAGGIDRAEVAIDGGAFEEVEIVPLDDIIASPTLFFGDDTAASRSELADLRDGLLQLNDADFSDPLPYVWALWQFEAELSSGEHEALVRATSTDGTVQPDQDLNLEDGNSQIRRVRFEVR